MTQPLLFRLASLGILALAWIQTPAHGQVAPFSMEPERSGGALQEEQPEGAASPLQYLKEPGETVIRPAAPKEEPQPAVNATSVQQPEGFRRFVVPDSQLQLRGEMASRSWSVVLTPAQAASAVKLRITYQNAVFVAPETSSLRVSVNGETVVAERISSPDQRKKLEVALPEGLLTAGRNVFNVSVDQRHRTDCSYESTFDLWTEIYPNQTFLEFEDASASHLRKVSDIAAIGNNGKGRTPIRIVAPHFSQVQSRDDILRLAQAIAVIADMPRQSITVSETPPKDEDTSLTVYFGTAELLSPYPDIRRHIGDGPVVSFIDSQKSQSPVLLVSGSTWAELQSAVDTVAGAAAKPEPETKEGFFRTQNLFEPEPPLVGDAQRFRFSDLGLKSREFSGHRFHTELAFGLPADFYANAYGHFTIMLDAAFARDVLPGNHIDIYLNGEIATNVMVAESGGFIMNGVPISVPLRHARPGRNVVTINVSLKTAADETCAPGAMDDKEQRFVLFDTSELVFPDIARVGRVPDLASFASFGFPYNARGGKTDIVLGDQQAGTMSAAATFLSRLAVSAGKLLPLEVVSPAAVAADSKAVFIGNFSKLPADVVTQVGLGNVSRTDWPESKPSNLVTKDEVRDNRQTMSMWRQRLSEEGWRGRVSRFLKSIQDSFDITQQNLNLIPGTQRPYSVPSGTNVLVAQNVAPEGLGPWTVLTVPNGQNFETDLDVLLDRWGLLDGHISAFQVATEKVRAVEGGGASFVVTSPLSFGNLRLIFTNWMSVNIIVFGALFVAILILLGLAATALLRMYGRQS